MKLNKTLGRVATTFLATAMLASVSAVPAFAVDEGEPSTAIDSMSISKIVTTDGDTYAPATSFTFQVANGDAQKDFNDGTNTVDVTAGVTDGLTGTTIASTPDTDNPTDASYTFTGELGVDISKFTEPGVYHYVVTEETPNTPYEGIDYSTESYDVYVYVVNGTEGLEVDAVIAFKGNQKVQNVTFTNNYGEGTNDSTHDVIVTKNVEGSLANMSDTFSFDVSVNGFNGEAYKVVYTQNGTPVTAFVTSGETLAVDGVGDEDTIHIYGLSANDTYTVTEKDGEEKGYIVSDTDTESEAGTVTGNLTADNTQHSITNDKDASTPTGIMMDVAPYVLLVAVAAGCFVFLRKRRED